MNGWISFNILIKSDDTHIGGVLISAPKSSVQYDFGYRNENVLRVNVRDDALIS